MFLLESLATSSAFVSVPAWPQPLWPGASCGLLIGQLSGMCLFVSVRPSTQKQTASSWHMEDTSIMPAVPTSGSTVLSPNLLASSCLICSEKLLSEVQAGCCFSSLLSHPRVTGTNKQNMTTVKFTCESVWRSAQLVRRTKAEESSVLPEDHLCPWLPLPVG